MNLGELIVELSADSSELEKTLERAKKKAYEAAVAVEKSFADIELKIGVDDDSLVDLNKHLNLKVKHLKEVNKYFNDNPIVVNIDDSSLTDLNEHLNLKVKHLKEVNKYFDDNPIKVNTDTKSLDELEERLKKLSDKTITITVESELSKQLEKSLVDAVKNAVKEGMEQQTSASSEKEEKKEASPEKGKGMGRLVIEGMFTQVGENITRGLSQGLKDVSGADVETIARVTSNMILRYAGVGKEAQNDPSNSKKKSTEITKDALKAIIRQYEQEAMGLGSIAPNKTANESGKKQPKTAESSNKKIEKKLNNIAEDAIFDLFLGGNFSQNRIKNLALKTVQKTLKTLLPHTYSTVENLTSSTTQATSTESKLGQAATSLQNAAQSLNNAANTLNNSVSATDLMTTTAVIQSPVEEIQPLNVPLLPPSKAKKPKPELELVPIENTAEVAQEQLKQHIKSIRSNTFQNLHQSKQYADATAKENNDKLIPLEPIKAKKIDNIKVQKEMSLENIKASFKAINQYFAKEYNKLTAELKQVKKTGTPAEIKATREKFKKFIANSNFAIKDIDDTIIKAKETGFESHINSDLTDVYRKGKGEIRNRQQRAIHSEGDLNYTEKDIFEKQRKGYVNLAQRLGIDIDAGLAKGVKHGSDGVSDVARKMLDDLIETVEAKMKIQSPSWVMFEIGMMIASGLFFGMQKGNSKVSEGARKMVTTVKSAFDPLNDLSSLGLAGTYMIPNLSDISNKAMIAMSATSTGLNMLDKVGEHHAANPDQTLFQATYGTAKNFVKDAVTDKTFTQPREAVDHLVNIAKFGTELVTPLGLKAFTNPIGSANDGVAAAFRTMAIAKSLKQAHQDTKQQTQQDSTLNYASTFKNVLPQYLKANKIGRAEALKMFGGGLKVVPDMHGSNDANLYNAGALAMGTAASLGNAAISKFAPVANFVETGKDIVKGLEQGILKNAGIATNAIAGLGNSIQSQIKQNMGISSPSLVMFEIGMMIATGLFLGMQKGNSKVAIGARQLVSTVKDAVGSAKEILEPALAIGGLIPGVSTAATYGGVGLAAADSGLKMLDKVGERHAANPTQTLFQSAFESGKDFITELRADKTLTKPREAFDHFINLSKAGAATFGVNSFTAFDAAQSGMTALLRSGAIGKAVAQSHGETKTRLAEDPSLDYMTTYKAVLTEKLKDLKLTKPEIIKAIGSALKVVPTGFGTAANSAAETAGTVFADGIDALTIPRDLYRNIATKTAKGATHQQAIAESITDLGAPTQVADVIGSFGDKHSVSLNAFARMSGNVVENINRSLINTVAASSKAVSVSTNAVSNQVKKNMGHLPSQQPISKSDSGNVTSAAVASDNASSKPFTSIGGNIMKGLGKGMADSIGSVTKVMDNAGNAIQSQIKQNMGISSPSKVMIALGLMITSGLAIGIKKGAINVDGSMEAVVGSISSGVKKYTNIRQFFVQSLNKNPNNVISQLIQSLKKDFGSNTILGNVFNSAMSAFGKGGGLKDISVNFISSFGKGVLASTGGVTGIVSNFASSVIGAIKKVFGIASPSKIMMAIGLIFGNSFKVKALSALLSAKLAISQVMNDIVDNIRNIVSSQPPVTPPKLKKKTLFNMFADLSTADVLGATHRFISPILPKHLQSNDVQFYKQLYQGQNTPGTILKNTFDEIKSNIKPGGLIDGYLKLGTDLATNIFTAVSTSIHQTTLSGYASLGQTMRNAVNAALFSLADTLKQPLHQALLSQTRSILPWFLKFIPRSFQLLPKLSFAVPLVGGLALKLGNSIVKNLLENNLLKEGGFLTNLLSSITRINLPALPGVKKSNLIKGLGDVLSPLPFLMTASPISGLPLPFSSLISSLVAEPGSHYRGLKNPGLKKKAPTVEQVLQNQTQVNREKAQLRDVAGTQASKEFIENLGNTLLDKVLINLDIPVIPRSVVQGLVGKKLGEESGSLANILNSMGTQKSKAEQLLAKTIQSGRTDLGKRTDILTRQALRERGVSKTVRDAMTPDQLAAAREKILGTPLDLTPNERKLLQAMGDTELLQKQLGTKKAERRLDALTANVLKERGLNSSARRQIKQDPSGYGFSDFRQKLANDPRTGGFMGRLTEAYASNDQDAMKGLVKEGLRKTGMSAKQIDAIDPKLLDTATAGLMTTLSGLQAKFREKGFDMGKALSKGLKDSMVNLANAKDDLEYNAKKAIGQANFGDSLKLIMKRIFRGTAATQEQFTEMYNQMGSGVKKVVFGGSKEGDDIFPNVLQFMGSLATTFAPITTMIGAITPLLLPLAPIITGIGMAVNMVAPHVAKLIDGIQRVEILQRRFKFLGGSTEGGKAELNYAKDIAGKLNVPSEVAANSYSQLAIAAKDSKMEGQGVKELFEGITSSLSALGINGQDASLVFTAYTQILAKGKLSMEELRQQLGEKFPPAMATFARAMGVTVPEMNELVASGSILSQDILPKVAKVLKEDYGSAASDQAGGLVVALNKLGNVGFEITTIFADQIGGTLGFFVDLFANILGLLKNTLNELIPLAQSFMIGFATSIAIGLTIILTQFGPFVVAMKSLQGFLLATFSAITTNMMPMVVGIMSDVADGWLGAERNLMDNMVQGVSNMIITVFSTIDTVMRSMSDHQVSFGTVFGGLIQGAEQAGSIIDWLKGVFAGFFKILPSGIVEILAIVFMLEQAIALVMMALWPAITKLWGGFTGMFKASWTAFRGVMGTIKSVTELMMTSSALGSQAVDQTEARSLKRTSAINASLAFLKQALLHFGIAYAVMMFSKGDFSDPLRESINKSTADINKHLNQVRLNIGQTTEAFNKATKSVEKLGNTITHALPAKGVQLDVRSLWGGGDWKWDDAVRETNAKYRKGGSGLSAMDVIGTGALYAGGAGYAAAAGSKAIKAITDLAVKTAPILASNTALGSAAGPRMAIPLFGRLATAIAPVVAIMGPWGLAIAGLIATIVAVGVALDAFAPKITEAQLKNTEEKGGLPKEIKQIINAKEVGERLDASSMQVIKLYEDQKLNNERLKEFMASIGLDGKNPYSFVARPVVPMTQEQKDKFESEIPVQNITKSIEDKKASLQELEKNAGTTETEKSKARSKQGYKTVQEELTKLEKDKLLMQLSFMANYDNKPRMDAIDKQIKAKEKEIADSYKDSRNFDYTTDGFGGASTGRNIKADELTKELEKLQKDKSQLQTNINASAKRRVNYDAIKKIDVDMQKTAAEFVKASNQLAVSPNDKLRNKAGLAKERIAQLQKQRQKLVDEFGDPTPAIKQMLEVTKREIEKTLSDSSILPQQRKVTVQQLRKTQETLEKSLAEAEKFSIAPIADTMYTQAVAALKDNEVKSNVDISKNKIVSNQAQARLYGTTLTSQQIAPGLSDRQIADLTFQQKVLERSLKIKEDSLLKLQNAAAQSPTNLSQVQEEITKLQQEIAKDREQVSQNTLEIVKAQREARQALIDQTKQVAEYYRTSLRESQAAAIEFDKATNNIKSQQFATKLKQALVGAGNNIFTNFIDSVIGLFQQLTEIENLRLDRQKQKLDYENNIQDILIKVTEMQRSLPGKIVPFSLDQIRNFGKELGTVNSSVSGINKEVNSVTKNLGVSAVNSTIQLNKQLKEVLSTVEKINKVTSNQQLQPPNNSGVSSVPISQRTEIPVTPKDEQIWREFVAPQSGIKSGTSSLPTSTPVANATKEMLVAGLMSDMGMGYSYYSQVAKSKPKLPDNAFLSPIVGKNLSNIINTKYRPEDSFGKTGGIQFNQNIGVGKNTNIQSSVTGMARLIGNTLEIIKQTKGGTIKLIYEGLNIPSVKKNLKLNNGGSVNINAGQLIGTLAGNNFKFRTEVNSSNMDPLKVIKDIEYKRLNAFQKAARFFDQPNKAVTNLGLLPEPKPVATSSTPSTPPVNRAINWFKTEVKKFVRENAPEEVKRVIRNTKNFVDNIPPIISTYNQNTNSYNPGILDILIGNNSKPNPKPNNSTGSSGNNQGTGKKQTTTNQGTGKKPTATNQNKSGSGTNQGTGKKPTPTNQSNVPNLSGAFPQPSTGRLTTVSNTGNQIPPDLSGAFPQSSGITLTNASTGGNNNQGKKQNNLLVSPIPGKTLADILKFPYTDDEKKDGAGYGSARGVNINTQLKAPISGKATLYIYKGESNEDLVSVGIAKNINGKQIAVWLNNLSLDSIKKNLGNLKHQSSFSIKAGQPIGTPQQNRDLYMGANVQGKDLTIVDFIKNSQSYGFSPQGLTTTPSTGAGQTPTNNNTGKLPSPQPQVPNIAGKPGTNPLDEQKKGGYVDPNTSQRFTTKAAEEAAKAAAQRDAAARLQRQEEISAKLVEFQRNLSNLLRDTNKGIRDESLQAAQDINNASEYIQGLLNPNASDKEKFATDFQKLKNEYQARINEQQNIIESTRAPLAELAKVDELIAAAQREGIDASGLKRLRDEVYRVVKARERTAIALRNMYTKNKQAVFDKYVSRFKEEQSDKDADRKAALLGVNISQLKLRLEELRGIQAIDPLNPELLKIPDLEANIAELELTQTTLQKIAALRREWRQSGGKNMGKDVYDKRMQDIKNTVTKQTGIIERKRRTDNTVAYVNRELGLIDKGAAEREPITKGLQLDNSLFAARNKNGLVNIINFENEALIKQKELMDSYRKTSLETQRDFKLSSDERITKRLRNAMNLQKELNVLKIETEYQKATGEIKNRQVTVDVQVKLSDAAKAIFESKSTIKKNLGLELAGERLDRQNAITTQENEYKRKQNETSQFILDNNLTDSQAYVLRKNNEVENDLKLRTIKSQFSEFAQLIKSFVSGFKSSFKEFLLSTEDTGTALLNLAKGIGKSVLDTLAEMASKRVTDLLFGWMGGTGLNPATELSFAAQQLTQAAYALQNAGNGSIAGASGLEAGSFGGFTGFGGIDFFSSTGTEFLDPSTFAASDFGSASLSGFAKGGMIDKDTLGKIQNFANGGIVGTMNKERAMTGRTPHLVVASEGERVLNHKETAIWNKLQSGISGFADGGIVGGGSGDIASKIGGSTTTVNVPVSVSVNEGSDVDGARLSQTVQALVSDGIRREMRPGGSIRRGNPYNR